MLTLIIINMFLYTALLGYKQTPWDLLFLCIKCLITNSIHVKWGYLHQMSYQALYYIAVLSQIDNEMRQQIIYVVK